MLHNELLQLQYEKIQYFFKTTTEPFDFLEWDGKVLNVWFRDAVVEKYEYKELKEFIEGI